LTGLDTRTARRATGADGRRSRRRWADHARPALVAVVACAVVAVVAVVDPNEPGRYPTCPFLALTGYYCPGCGSTRAVHALVHGDVLGALALNPLAVAALPFLAGCWLRWVGRVRSGAPRPRPVPGVVLQCLAAVVVGFWFLRNIPAGAALAP
jgi:hypothetical protein